MKQLLMIIVCSWCGVIQAAAQSDTLPMIAWSSYFGEKLDDRMIDVARYGDGGFVIVGTTVADSSDIVVSRFTVAGVRTWTTIISGEASDVPTAVVVNKVGEIFVAGHTRSANNIATRGAYQEVAQGGLDGFLMAFDANGQRMWGSYIGGTEDDQLNDMIQSDRGDLIVVGATASANMASSDAFQLTLAGGRDGYLGSFTIDGFPNSTTYFGGPNDDVLTGVAGDGQGLIYVAGTTNSTNLATSGAAQEVFGGGASDVVLASFFSISNLNWCTYVGADGDDAGLGPNIVHANGHVYFCGRTTSTSTMAFPGAYHDTFAGETDGFVMSYAVNGQKVWGTYLGGRELDEAISLTTNGRFEAVVIGWTKSDADIATDGAYQTQRNGPADAVIWNFDSEGTIRWSTYFGGSDIDVGASITPMSNDDFIIVGETSSPSGLAILPPHQANLSSAVNGFYARLTYCIAPSPEISGPDTACLDGQQRSYSTPLVAGNTYLWQTPRLGTIKTDDTLATITIDWTTIGTDTLLVYETTQAGCLRIARKVVVVAEQPDNTITSSTGLYTACDGDTLILTVKDSTASVLWSTGESTRSINVTSTVTLNATISKGACTTIVKGLQVTFNEAPRPAIQGSSTVCVDADAEYAYAVNPTAGDLYTWLGVSNGTYRTRTDTTHVRITWTTPGTDTVRMIQTRPTTGCTGAAQIVVTISAELSATVTSSTGDTILCAGDSLILSVAAGLAGHEWSTGENTPKITVRTPGIYFVKVTDGNCTALSDTITIVERQRPTPQITGPTEVCLATSTSATFNVGRTTGDRLQWELPIIGTTTSPLDDTLITVSWTGGGVDTIRVHEYAGIACVGSSEWVVNILEPEACASTTLFSVSDVDFGTVPVDSLINANGGHVNEFIVVNTASFDLSLDSAMIDDAVFAIPNQFPRLMRPGDTSRITVRFAPTALTSYTGQIRVYFGTEVGLARARGVGRQLAADERITEVILQPDRIEVQPGETFEVIIALGEERPTPATSTEYEATMQWDARVLELVSTPEVFFRTTGREDNYFTAKVPEGTRSEGQRELIRIPFRAKLADVDSTILVFSGATAFRWKDDTKAYPACRDSVVKITICRDEAPRLITKRAQATLSMLAPMPVDEHVEITINASARTNVQLDVIDQLGTVVEHHDLGTIPSGTTSTMLDVRHLSSGPYIIRLRDGWKGDARPLIKR